MYVAAKSERLWPSTDTGRNDDISIAQWTHLQQFFFVERRDGSEELEL